MTSKEMLWFYILHKDVILIARAKVSGGISYGQATWRM